MAGWQDGAEYASRERPDAFAAPIAEPLPVAEPYQSATPGAIRPPRSLQPPVSAIPLHQIVPDDSVSIRDPRTPFAVASSTMTDSAWGAAHRADAPMWAPNTFDPAQPMFTSGVSFPPPDPHTRLPQDGPLPIAPAPGFPAPPAPLPPVPGVPFQSAPWAAQQGLDPWQAAQIEAQTRTRRQLTGVAIGVLLMGLILNPVSWASLLIASGLTYRATQGFTPSKFLFIVPVCTLVLLLTAPVLFRPVNQIMCLCFLVAVPMIAAASNNRNR